MMTKKQLVDEVLSIKEVDTKANLMKKSQAQLEKILDSLEAELVAKPVEEPKEPQEQAQAPQVDMQALMEQMKQEMMEQLKEQARKEVEAEQVNTSEATTTEPVNHPVSKRMEIDRFAQIPIMNVTNGKLIYESRKTGAAWRFLNYGDMEYMEFQELLTMRSSQRKFFDEPFILVMDDDAVEHLGLTKMYANIKNPEQIDDVFKLSQLDFEDVLDKSPRGIKHLIISRAKQLYESGELDSIKKINHINDRYQTDIGQRG
jgi:hypothetical protein